MPVDTKNTQNTPKFIPPFNPSSSPEWARLRAHRAQFDFSLHELFQENPSRSSEFSITDPHLTYDFSKTHLTRDSIALLSDFARASALESHRADMFSGEKINLTEHRAALHTALRAPATALPEIFYSQQNFREQVKHDLEKMEVFVEKIHSGDWRGASGLAITDIVHLGIGGSDLGPRFVTDALYHDHLPTLHVHFVANVDPEELSQTLVRLNPETTLFIIASKSFHTQETLLNAESAKIWLIENLKKQNISPQIQQHFVAISSNIPQAIAFGISPDNCFGMSDAIGGRYSLWSSIGLPIALAIGMKNFRELLAGAYAMDQHFQEAPLDQNIPVMMAFISLWYRNFWGSQSYAILPYSHRLALLPSFLQQLEMESLGKSVLSHGQPCPHQTGGVIWGGVGTNGQHAFHQLLHQGTTLIPADFIVIQEVSSKICSPTSPNQHYQTHQKILNTHAKAQMQALLQGKSLSEAKAELAQAGKSPEEISFLAPHKVIPGNRPSVGIYLQKLGPFELGQLLAAYEHKVFCLSVFLGINAFDQFGVELGKALAEIG
jgi:glucose-6-phosphate isomerase